MKKIYVTPELEAVLFDSDIRTDIIKTSGWSETTDNGVDTGFDYDWGMGGF